MTIEIVKWRKKTYGIDIRIQAYQNADGLAESFCDVAESLQVKIRVYIHHAACSNGRLQLPGMLAIPVKHDVLRWKSSTQRQLHLIAADRDRRTAALPCHINDIWIVVCLYRYFRSERMIWFYNFLITDVITYVACNIVPVVFHSWHLQR